MNKTKLREAIEKKMGVLLKRGWHLDGAGPSRYGWGAMHPCKTVFLARPWKKSLTRSPPRRFDE
jgi:hypothetical protein